MQHVDNCHTTPDYRKYPLIDQGCYSVRIE